MHLVKGVLDTMGREHLAVLEAGALANFHDQRAPLPVGILHTRERSGVS